MVFVFMFIMDIVTNSLEHQKPSKKIKLICEHVYR